MKSVAEILDGYAKHLPALTIQNWDSRLVVDKSIYDPFWPQMIGYLKPDHVLELGTGAGVSSSFILVSMTPTGKLTTVDLEWDLDNFRFGHLLNGMLADQRLRFIRGNLLSDSVVDKVAERGEVDLLFIDSEHYSLVKVREWELYRKVLRPGAFVVVDNLPSNDMMLFWDALPYNKIACVAPMIKCPLVPAPPLVRPETGMFVYDPRLDHLFRADHVRQRAVPVKPLTKPVKGSERDLTDGASITHSGIAVIQYVDNWGRIVHFEDETEAPKESEEERLHKLGESMLINGTGTSRMVPFTCDGVSFVREVFIETGTDSGYTTIHALRSGFKECHTIDVDPVVVGRARELFARVPNIQAHLGSSPDVLPHIMDLNRPTTFWLDAHGKDSCPLLDELAVILGARWRFPPLIMIDDISQESGEVAGWPILVEAIRLLSNYRTRIVNITDNGVGTVMYCLPKD